MFLHVRPKPRHLARLRLFDLHGVATPDEIVAAQRANKGCRQHQIADKPIERMKRRDMPRGCNSKRHFAAIPDCAEPGGGKRHRPAESHSPTLRRARSWLPRRLRRLPCRAPRYRRRARVLPTRLIGIQEIVEKPTISLSGPAPVGREYQA